MILEKKDYNHPIIEHICINAAGAFLTLDVVSSLEEGYQQAKLLFESEKVTKKIKLFKKRSHELATTTL